MKRSIFGLFTGLTVIIASSILLWMILPIVFSIFNFEADYWLGILPILVFPIALILGGFITSKVVLQQHFILSTLVGVIAGLLGILATQATGQLLFLFLIVLASGVCSCMGGLIARMRRITT